MPMWSKVTLYLKNNLIAADQGVNTLLGGAPDETISSRMWRKREHRAAATAVRVIDWLFSGIEDGHCRRSFEKGDRHLEEVWK